jgi:hypothetical protein
MSKILEHVEQELQSFFGLLVPNAIELRSLLYGGQASSSKTTFQEVKEIRRLWPTKLCFI